MSSSGRAEPRMVKYGVPTPFVSDAITTIGSSIEKEPDPKAYQALVPISAPTHEEKHSLWNSYGGMLMALSASTCFSVSMLMVKTLASDGLHSFGAALLFNIGFLVPCAVFIIYNEYAPGWKNRERVFQGLWPVDSAESKSTLKTLAVQGIVQGMAVIFRTYSVKYLSLADTTVIVFSSPVVTTVFAHFMLGEPCGAVFIGIALYTFVGVILITKPPVLTGEKEFDRETLIGSALAVGALISLSFKFVITRKIKKVHFLAMSFSLGLIGVIISLPLFLIFEDPSSLFSSTLMGAGLRLGICLLAFCGVLSINLALKMEDAGLVSLIRSCDVIFAFLLQYIFLDVVPDILSVVGATIVCSGVLIAGGRKMWIQKAERRKRRNHLPKF